MSGPIVLPRARIGLFLAAVALLPGVLALLASGAGGVPASGLALTEAAGAFSVAALQGLERRLGDGPAGPVTAPSPAAALPPFAHSPATNGEIAFAFPACSPSHPLPLRL